MVSAMDHFGIGAAMRTAAMTYVQMARRTGRTTSLVGSLKNGDRVIFHDRREADRVGRLCLDRGVAIECLVISPKDLAKVSHAGRSIGRTIFDHCWVEQFYLHQMQWCDSVIDEMQRAKSGDVTDWTAPAAWERS